MKKIPIGLSALAAAALLLTGCSSDSDAPNPPETDQEPHISTEESTSESNGSAAALGAVRVNEAVTYSITELRRCEPVDQDMIETELELQGLGEHDGERIQIDVYLETIAGAPHNHFSWAGPEGVFSSDPLDGTGSDARITWGPEDAGVLGSGTLFDSMTGEDQIMVDFDLQVPAETIACR